MRRVLTSLCAVAVVAAGLAAGCGHDSGAGRPGRATTAARGADLRPLTWQEELRVSDAQQRLTARCMRRHGFEYREDRSLTLRESMPVRYVQDDVAWARTYGYGGRIEAEQERLRLHNPIAAYRRGLSAERRAAFDTALDGGRRHQVLSAELPGSGLKVRKRIGGCTAEAEKALYGDPALWFRTAKTATGLNALYADDLLRDRRFGTAVRAWSRCMRRAGLAYADPQAARDATRANTARLGPTRADEAFESERRTAVADATCARRTSLKTVATDREAYYVDRLRDRYGAALDTYRRLQRQAYERAARIVPQRA